MEWDEQSGNVRTKFNTDHKISSIQAANVAAVLNSLAKFKNAERDGEAEPPGKGSRVANKSGESRANPWKPGTPNHNDGQAGYNA